jgi:hypothetical protein
VSFQEGEAAAVQEEAGVQKKLPLAVLLICAVMSVFFMNLGFLSMFFLAPFGYAILACGSIWPAFFASAGVYALFSFSMRLISGGVSGGMLAEIIYFAVLFLCFAWIINSGKFTNIRTAYRFVLSASAAAFAFLLVFVFNPQSNSTYNNILNEMSEMLSVMLVSNSGEDAVQNSFLQQTATPENIKEMIKAISLRGGAVVSIFFMFFINRQISITAYWFIKKQRSDRGLTAFFAPANAIWVLSASLAVIILSRLFQIKFFEIIAWNVFVICVILFMAQGAGIVMYMFASRTGIFRIIASLLIIVVILSPVLTFAIAALPLLGIAENWLPFRTAKKGQVSTPKPPDSF